MRYDRLAIEAMDLQPDQRELLLLLLDSRGEPQQQLQHLNNLFGHQPVFQELMRLTQLLEPAAGAMGLRLQLDTTFQPEYKLYTGLVFQLVCQGKAAPVVIARGGRYDDLVYRCGARGEQAAGVGFSFAIDPIRELLNETPRHAQRDAIVLVAFSAESSLESALRHQSQWHQKGCRAFVELAPVANRQAAEEMARVRRADRLDWIDS